MNKYIMIDIVEARKFEATNISGYEIVNDRGSTERFVPEDKFLKNTIRLEGGKSLKSEISISQKMVDDFIKETYVSTIGDKTTLVRVVLINGFEIVESSACVDKENYDESIGAEICLDKIKGKIWSLLGFLLQTAVGLEVEK